MLRRRDFGNPMVSGEFSPAVICRGVVGPKNSPRGVRLHGA